MPSNIETTQHITSLYTELPHIDENSQPLYNKVLLHIIDTRNAPPEEPVAMFGNIKPGMIGINRLEQIFRCIDIIQSKCLPDNGKFTKNQWAMITDFISTALPKIVTTAEYVLHRQEYLDYLNIETDGRFAGVLGSRQIGKTTCTAAVVAAIVTTCPNVSVGLYASKLGQASILQTRIVEFIGRLGKTVDFNKTEGIATFHHAGRLTSVVRAYSMNTEVRSTPALFHTWHNTHSFRHQRPRSINRRIKVGCPSTHRQPCSYSVFIARHHVVK